MAAAVAAVDDAVLTSDDDDTVGVTELDARTASSASDDGITCRKRSVCHRHAT